MREPTVGSGASARWLPVLWCLKANGSLLRLV
jgi:hypothetical protein